MSARPIQFFVTLLVLSLFAGTLAAQESPAEHQHSPEQQQPGTLAGRWTWTTDANFFFGYNYQQRKYADFSAWESQN